MKRIIYLIVVFFCLFGSNAMAQIVKHKVAVYVTGDVENGYKKVIGSKLVSSITRSNEFVAVERTTDFLAELQKEQDYQTSGAVSDNQIVKLGQQFGVRYVLVADLSEIFESLFISVRMIDVQTGQIIGATESSNALDSMDGLINLSETVISELLDDIFMKNNNLGDIKIIGPLTYTNLHTFYEKIPNGYHHASIDEVKELIQIYKKSNKKIAFPIYAGLTVAQSGGSNNYHITASLFKSETDIKEFNHHYYWMSSYGDWRDVEELLAGYIYLIKN